MNDTETKNQKSYAGFIKLNITNNYKIKKSFKLSLINQIFLFFIKKNYNFLHINYLYYKSLE
jgi:hypothetical protein